VADHTLTPAQRDAIDATVTRVHRERSDAGVMAAKYDAACERISEMHDEIVRRGFQIEALEDKLRDRDASIRALEAEIAILRAADTEPGDTKLTGIGGGPGEGTTVSLRPPELLMRAFIASMIDMLGDATNYVEMEASNPDGLGRYLVRVQRAGGKTPHALREEAEERARVAERRAAELEQLLAATTAPHRAPVQHIDIYESSDYDVAAALEQAAEVREPITVTTCNNTVTTYRAVPLDAHPRTERSTT
jgi:hypothetical protein